MDGKIDVFAPDVTDVTKSKQTQLRQRTYTVSCVSAGSVQCSLMCCSDDIPFCYLQS